MRTPASRVAVTFPSVKPPSFRGPIAKPERERQEHREFGIRAQGLRRPSAAGAKSIVASRSVLVEHLLDLPSDPTSCVSASLSSTRDFAGLSSFEATVPTLSSSTSMLRRMIPSPTRLDRTTTTPFAIARFTASSAGVVMLPSPTPAMTRPFAPFATAASMRSGDMPACA